MSAAKQSNSNFDLLPEFVVTPSVRATLSFTEPQGLVTSWTLLENLLGHHSEYGNKQAKDILSQPPQALREKTMQEWCAGLVKLFDPNAAQPFHGRLLVFGLAKLDRELNSYLEKTGFLENVIREIGEPIESLLRHEETTSEDDTTDTSADISDRPSFHLDNATIEDRLGRLGFAKALAVRLRNIWYEANEQHEDVADQPSYVIQLDGPWGAGKSSVLRMLTNELETTVNNDRESGQKWLVVNFNAWKNQRINPPWWFLHDSIYRGAIQNLSANRAKVVQQLEIAWRRKYLSDAGLKQKITAAILFGVLLVGVFFLFRSLLPDTSSLETGIKTVLEIATLSIGLILTLWGVSKSVSTEWMQPSARSAKQFESLTDDPMGVLKQHFQNLLGEIRLPVLVLVDDLDRCRADYTVQLLEGMQTLFNDSRIFYIVAADRRWLSACFEQEYRQFRRNINEPGRPLGRLFLEKAFQLEISLPGITKDYKNRYIKYLLESKAQSSTQNIMESSQEFEDELAGMENDQAVLSRVVKGESNPVKNEILRQKAVIHLAGQKVEAGREQFLARFALLMENNPRAMKRLLQAYSMNLSIMVLRRPELVATMQDRIPLVLWTILNLRWPMLADMLRRNPDYIAELKQGLVDGESAQVIIPEWVNEPVVRKAVKDVINGESIGRALEVDDLSNIVYELSPRV